MKPLSIEELKALKVGDWVYAIILDAESQAENFPKRGYFQKTEVSNKIFLFYNFYENDDDGFDYSDYGKTWLAYKNKEQAETEGEMLELPCLRDLPVLMYHGQPLYRKELNYMTKDKHIVSVPYSEDEFEEAERRLEEEKEKCKHI